MEEGAKSSAQLFKEYLGESRFLLGAKTREPHLEIK